MIKLASSTEKTVSTTADSRPKLSTLRIPTKSIKEDRVHRVLTYPKQYRENWQPLSDPFLEDLIQKNVIESNSYPRGEVFAFQARAFFNVLPEKHKKLFSEIVQAFNKDQENLPLIKGAIFSGGEMRVIAEAGAALVINTLAEMLGIVYSEKNNHPTFNTFAGTSAGAFPAIAFASRVRNSDLFKMSAYYDFTQFYRSPETVERKFNGCARKGVFLATGKKLNDLKVKDINNLGSDLQVLLAEKKGWIRNFMSKTPRVFLAPKEIQERYGIDPKNIRVGELALKTSNLVFLQWNLGDKTCGNCYFEDNDGKKHYIYDPGAPAKYGMPLVIQENEIKKYKNSEAEKPAFYFLVGNKRAETSEMPEMLFGKPTPKGTYWIYCKAVEILDWYDKYVRGDTAYHVGKNGGDKSYIEASCEVKDSKTNEVAKLGVGEFSLSPRKREILIYENILLAIEQIHKQLIDINYVQDKGGKSPYKIYLEGINKTIGKTSQDISKPDQSKVVFLVKNLIEETKSTAASL